MIVYEQKILKNKIQQYATTTESKNSGRLYIAMHLIHRFLRTRLDCRHQFKSPVEAFYPSTFMMWRTAGSGVNARTPHRFVGIVVLCYITAELIFNCTIDIAADKVSI